MSRAAKLYIISAVLSGVSALDGITLREHPFGWTVLFVAGVCCGVAIAQKEPTRG